MFINKLWNACRFVSSHTQSEGNFSSQEIYTRLTENFEMLEIHEKWILSRISHLTEKISTSMEEYSFSFV